MKKLQDGQSIHFISVRDRAGGGGESNYNNIKAYYAPQLSPL